MPDLREGAYVSNVAALMGGGGFTPADLGSSLLANWDAEATSSLTLSGSSVTTWTDTKNGYAPTQATGGSKPVWDGASFNNRPGITFDGIDDYLSLENQPFPTDCEIWALLDQTAPAADGVTNRVIAQFGGAANSASYSIRRTIGAGPVNRVRATGSTSVDNNANFSGIHIARGQCSLTSLSISQDGNTPESTAVSNTLGSTRIRLGASSATVPVNFLQGIVNSILVTTVLTAGQANSLLTFLKARGGIA